MNSLFRCSKLGTLFIIVFLLGCTPNADDYSPEIHAIKSYQDNRILGRDAFIDRSFTVSPSPKGQEQLEQLANILTKQAENEFKLYATQYKNVLFEYQAYERTDVINEDFTDIYDSWSSIAISPDSGEVPLTLNDVGESNHLVTIQVSKVSNRSDAGCRFRLVTKIYHHYWVIGSTEESFIDKILDIPCSNWAGWE